MTKLNKNSYNVLNRLENEITPLMTRRINEYHYRFTNLTNDVYSQLTKHFIRNVHLTFTFDESLFKSHEMNRQEIVWLNNHLVDLGYSTFFTEDVDDYEIQVSLK